MHPTSNSLRRAQPLLGTFVEIASGGASRTDTHAAIEVAFEAMARVHSLMSFHAPQSDVSRLNHEAAAGAVAVDPWTFHVLEAAIELGRRSGGIFDIAVARALQDIGLLPRRRYDRSRYGSATMTSDAIELLPGHRVRFGHAGLRIDLGGIAKGFAVDRAVEALRAHGVSSGLVNAGGDLAAFGPQPEVVCIRDPRDPRRLLGRVAVHNQALASTAGRFDPFESPGVMDFAVIDPRTQLPALATRGATVRAASCMLADALTKTVTIAGVEAIGLLEHYQASALVVLAGGDVLVTTNWPEATDHAA